MSATIGRILLIPKGTYNGSTVYNSLDWVRDDGKAWVCKKDGTVGITPAEGANWTLLAADGNAGGAMPWSNVSSKPFDTIDTTNDFEVDAVNNNKLKIKRDTYGTMRIVSGGTTTNLEASGDSTFEIDAGTNVTITADDTANPKKITINSSGGGGGSSTFAGLSDTDVNNPQADQIVQYKSVGGQLKLQNVNMPQGGHAMLPTPNANLDEDDVVDAVKGALFEGGANDDVPSLFGIGTWANCDAKLILTTAAQGDTGIGTWADTSWESGTRSGWLWSEALYHVLEDENGNRNYNVEVIPVFDIGESETVSLYAYRIDDDYSQTIGGVSKNGGCVAFKFNGSVQNASGVKVGVKLVYQRTEVNDTGRIIS